MADSSTNILRAAGPLWIGLGLVSLIVGAFFDSVWRSVMPENVMLYLLTVWAILAPGVIMLWLVDRKM